MNYRKTMQTTLIGLAVLALSAMAASACKVNISVACPSGVTAAGIEVCVDGVGCTTTGPDGLAYIYVPSPGIYTFRVTKSTLPQGANVSPSSQQIDVVVDFDDINWVYFELGGGNFCSTPLPGPCWMTGGGTINRESNTPEFTYGGVVYPGCSPNAAQGGNWNVVAHLLGLHFQGQTITVDSCGGVSTKSPKVNVNIIDFHGSGILSGIGGNSTGTIPVTFVGRAVDNLEPGHNSDMLFLSVVDSSSTVVLQIGTSMDDPAIISTGNIQIHTSSCD